MAFWRKKTEAPGTPFRASMSETFFGDYRVPDVVFRDPPEQG
jgi:hypothetical protein